jgi:putative methylase
VKKKELALFLGRLDSLTTGKPALEQYQTPSELAAEVLWVATMHGDIEGKSVADLGCGNGILGCGALLLGAKKVFFVDADKNMLSLARQNVEFLEKETNLCFSSTFVHASVQDFVEKIDCVLQNPPFGVQVEHADRDFLLAAMRAKVAYSFHKVETKDFVERFVKEQGKKATLLLKRTFPLPKTMSFHQKRVYSVPVGIWRIS